MLDRPWRSRQNEHLGENQSVKLAHPRKEPHGTLNEISADGSPSVIDSRIDVYWAPVDRRGRFRAELADGTVLAVSRQPFLDAARVLISAGYSPEIMLVGLRKGSAHWSLQGRLSDAAKLTVDETKTGFAKWKAFSSSAVAAAVEFNQGAATSLATPPANARTGSPGPQTSRRKPLAPSR